MVESHPRQGATSVDKEPDSDKSTECRYCDRDFESYSARRKHEGISHKEPYQDKDTLEELYLNEKMSMADIGEHFDVPPTRIGYWLDKHDIETRDVHAHHSRDTAIYRMDDRGYMVWSAWNSEKGQNEYMVVHRLLAVAEYGVEAVAGKVVHHKNDHKWDNRPENIELMTAEEHSRHHYEDTLGELQ